MENTGFRIFIFVHEGVSFHCSFSSSYHSSSSLHSPLPHLKEEQPSLFESPPKPKRYADKLPGGRNKVPHKQRPNMAQPADICFLQHECIMIVQSPAVIHHDDAS